MSIEFTGERVVPGHVDVDLWNEHYARYAFATRYCKDKRVLDAGCGTGYGSNAISAEALGVIGIDLSQDAVTYANTHYTSASLHWAQSSCTQIPFASGSFDVVLAFEVIEHLQDWPSLITEARRVLVDAGVFLVSTPNKSVYAESREQSGPNPFHEHEFELDEFTGALTSTFAHVTMLLQNHSECVSLESIDKGRAEVQLEGASNASEASFYIAVCSMVPIDVPSFVYVPRAANVLRERELHIRQLESELATKNDWLAQTHREHAELVRLHTDQTNELRASNAWAKEIDGKLAAARDRIVQLQTELATEQQEALKMAAGYQAHADELQRDLETRTQWAQAIDAQLKTRTDELAAQVAELGRCVALLDQAEATVVERTNWALRLQSELEQVQARLATAQSSRWIKLGRILNVGPELNR